MPLSIAPTVPATWVPWPSTSRQAVRSLVEQLYPPTTFRSATRAIPVSTIATSASTRSSIPLIFAIGLTRSLIRMTPVGIAWVISIFSSLTIIATDGSWLERGDLAALEVGRVAADRVP